jgi:flagellar hook-length control protein FliK
MEATTKAAPRLESSENRTWTQSFANSAAKADAQEIVGAERPSPGFSSVPNSAANKQPALQNSSSNQQEGETGSGNASTAPSVNSFVPQSTTNHDGSSFSQAVTAAATAQSLSVTNGAPATAPSETPSAAPTIALTAPEHPSATESPVAPQASSSSPAPNSLSDQYADPAAGRFVSNAQLTQAATHSEIRVALDTDKLGSVELRAHLVGDQVGAAITVEKRDAHAALAVDLPALRNALSEKQLRVEQITLSQGTLTATAGDAGGGFAKQNDRGALPAASTGSASWGAGSAVPATLFAGAEQAEIFDSQGRLSVLA